MRFISLHAMLIALAGSLASSAAASADNGDAAIKSVGLAAPHVLEVTILEGESTLGEFLPYKSQAGDERKVVSPQLTRLIRDGNVIGTLSGNEQSKERFVRLNDNYSGRRADRGQLTDKGAWKVELDGKPVVVTNAFRKSRIRDIAEIGEGRPQVCFEHTIFLVCEEQLTKGKLVIASSDRVIKKYESDFSPLVNISESIHVSLTGFRPDDPTKLAVLSCWMGDGGPFDYRSLGKLPKFAVVEQESKKVVLRGTATLLREPDQPADHQGLQGRPDGTSGNYAGTPTFELDFSKLDEPGIYRIMVEGIGTSRPFPIRRDVYRGVLELALEGLAAHRWGESRELRLIDGTTMLRPAAVPARHSDQTPVFETAAIYTNANFADFEPGKIGPWLPSDPQASIVGGYMDAGDFDRNHNHWIVGYHLLDLAARKRTSEPALAERLIEAALWDIGFWQRLQRDDGGVPSAVEYAEHPRTGEPSWLNTLPVYICAPSRESNLDFATSSAKAAAVLKLFGRVDEAEKFALAANKALKWAQGVAAENTDPEMDRDAFGLAAAELWVVTGDAEHRQLVLDYLNDRVTEEWSVVYPRGLTALMTLLEANAAKVETAQLEQAIVKRIAGSAKSTIKMNYIDGSTERSPFRALKNGWVGISFGAGGWPTVDSLNVLRAWHLFDDDQYLSAAVTGLAYCLGGNPNNMVYLTGLNERSVKNILHCDTRATGHRAPVGVPVYGPGLSTDLGSAWPLNWHLAGDQTIYPAYQMWPTYENVHEYWLWGLEMEYTVHQSCISAIYLAGMLDNRK